MENSSKNKKNRCNSEPSKYNIEWFIITEMRYGFKISHDFSKINLTVCREIFTSDTSDKTDAILDNFCFQMISKYAYKNTVQSKARCR